MEVFDQMSERSQMTGFNDGNTTKTMNVVTKDDKRQGLFGKLYGGYGTDDRYTAGATLNNFKNDTQLTFLGMSNNINQQNFGSDDVAGISGGGMRGGFRPGGGGNSMTSTPSGITNTNAVGLNFSDKLGKSGTFEGSYFFNDSHNSNDQLSSRESFRESGSQYYNEDKTSNSDNLNHRLNMRVTYDLNENNKLIYIPSFSFQDNSSLDHTIGQTTNSLGEIINQTDNTYKSLNKAYSINNNLLFQHKFEKIGRSMSINLDSRIRNTDRQNYYEDVYQDSLTQYLTDEIDNTLATTLTYTEPVGNSGELSASYRISFNNRDSDKETYLLDPETQERVFSPQLSNQFQSGYTTQLPTLMYSNRSFGKFFNIGVSYQHARLNNEQVYPQEGVYHNSFNSILPTAMGRLQFKGNINMFFRYATSTIAPSVTQLQNVIDNSNPLFFSIGNPELNQSYSHSLMLRLEKPNGDKNTSISNFSMVQMTKNYITNETEFAEKDTVLAGGIVVQEGTQISMPINLNGYWNISNTTTHSFSISPVKSIMNSSVGLGYVRRPGQTDNTSNISNTYSLNLKFSLVSNISEKVDFNTYYNVSGNRVFNSIQSQSNTSSNYIMQTVGVKANIIFWKGFVFRNDTYLEKYNGFSDDFNSSYVLWNMSIAKRFSVINWEKWSFQYLIY
ncbi:MAG: outer membrane beta-barrel protein [Cyclobacteriaceae bacterium]|nr:outer membrane beta-barrel protein [Cyclobacteriaceae bacterium]